MPVPFDVAVDRGRAAALTMREAEPAMRHGGARAKGEQCAYTHIDKRGSESSDYIASRLKRDHPDIAAAVERGEFASMRQAGIAAGFVKARKTLTLGDPRRLAGKCAD